MIPWVAVDLLDGRAVRLKEGRLGERTDYGLAQDALARWVEAGLRHIHLVDLGAAFGREESLTAFLATATESWPEAIFQVAGGIRSLALARRLAEVGAARVVISSVLFENPEESRKIVAELGPDRCVVALDVRDGRVRTRGWTADSGATLEEACSTVLGMAFQEVLVTDISRDGGLAGPNLELYGGLGRTGLSIIASAGITTRDDLESLGSLPHVTGAVIGKALYEGKLAPEDMKEVVP